MRLYSYLLTLTIAEASDSYLWCPGGTQKTSYSTRQVYILLRNERNPVSWHNEVWFSRGIPKHRFLAWLMALNRSPTRDRLLQCGIITDGSCLLCNNSLESRSHLFFYCSFSWPVWSSFLNRLRFSSSRSWEEIIEELRNFAGNRAERTLLLLAWQATIYALWSERNSRLHRHLFRSSHSLTVDIDQTVRRRIASIRHDAPQLSSDMLCTGAKLVRREGVHMHP